LSVGHTNSICINECVPLKNDSIGFPTALAGHWLEAMCSVQKSYSSSTNFVFPPAIHGGAGSTTLKDVPVEHLVCKSHLNFDAMYMLPKPRKGLELNSSWEGSQVRLLSLKSAVNKKRM